MDNPVLVEVTRGPLVESWHRGAFAIVDASGKIVASIGDIARPVYPRSAIKALQALPLVESGAAEALGYEAPELALACSSHNGEERHVNAARVMLLKAGLEEDALECGPQWPARMEDVAVLHRADEMPCPIHNNCSGKHAGFLGLAKVMGVPTKGYVLPDHPVQLEIKAAVESMTGATLGQDVCGTDGCSIPTYAVPLRNLAHAFAKFGTGEGLDPGRAAAAEALYDASVDNPFMVAGTERFCTNIMTIFGDRIYAKTGAEGVFCASIPELGLGIALKCDDGATRASEVMMAAIVDALVEQDEDEAKGLQRLLRPGISDRRGAHVGDILPVEEFSGYLGRM